MAKKVKKAAAKSVKKAVARAKKAASARGGMTRSAKRTIAKVVHKLAERVVPRRVTAAPAVSFPSAASPLVEDYLAIQQLLNKYCHVVDHGSSGDVAQLFHRDGALWPRHEGETRYEGREAVRGWYQHWIETMRDQARYLRHKIIAPAIEISGNEARAVSYFDVDAISLATRSPILIFGQYDDKFVKDEGRWWFKERIGTLLYSSSLTTHEEGAVSSLSATSPPPVPSQD